MKKVWESFVDDYGKELYKYPLATILEAFWNYSYDSIKGIVTERCDEVFKRYDKDG